MSRSDNIFIYGRNPIVEALSHRPSEVEKIFLRNNLQLNTVEELQKMATKHSIPVSKVPQQKIQRLVGRVNDQGIVALLSKIKYTDYFEWIQNIDISSAPAVLLLDGIEDPYNFGAILRTASAAGMSAVIVPTQKQAPVNAAVFKTSAGTAGRIPIIRVHDVNQGIKDLRNTGFEIVALHGNAASDLWEVDMSTPTAFLIGNEGNGLDQKIIQKSTKSIRIPMQNQVESLNASVSAGLVCYEWMRRKNELK